MKETAPLVELEGIASLRKAVMHYEERARDARANLCGGVQTLFGLLPMRTIVRANSKEFRGEKFVFICVVGEPRTKYRSGGRTCYVGNPSIRAARIPDGQMFDIGPAWTRLKTEWKP